MSGSILSGWGHAWEEMWAPLVAVDGAPFDLWSELISAVVPAPKKPNEVKPEVNEEGEIINPQQFVSDSEKYWRLHGIYVGKHRAYIAAVQGVESNIFFREFIRGITDEKVARKVVEDAYSALLDGGYDTLAGEFRVLVMAYVRTRNVLCNVTERCEIAPAVEELMVRFVAEIEAKAEKYPQIGKALSDVKEQLTDLRLGATHLRIRNAVSRYFVLMEAFANLEESRFKWSEFNLKTLDFPHVSFANIFSKLYSLRGDYPLLVHAGSENSASRELTEKDLISLTFMLFAFLPYIRAVTSEDTR